jgi:DNA-binding NtrC family response regulator
MRQIILVAEDEPLVRHFVDVSLKREGFVVLLACNANEALQVFGRNSNIDLLLTDVKMDVGMSGVALAERLMKEKPGIKVLLMSGYPETEILASEKPFSFLAKPFLPAVLIGRVREVLSSSG